MRPPTIFATSLAVAAFVPSVLGHGQVHSFITPSQTYAAADAYASPDPSSPVRKLNTYGPAANFTGPDITCGPGGNTPVTALADVAPGDLVTFNWEDWTSVHPGPVMTYIAACPNGCANFKGDTGNVWVKIDQDQYNPTRVGFEWGENIIRLKGNVYSVNIPNLVNGQYILRHEILGLHVASTVMGAQFYPNCVQIQITGSGTETLPAGIPLPGSYNPYDTNGILINLYEITPTADNYTAPGGPVIFPAGTGDWGVAEYGGGAIGSNNPTPVPVGGAPAPTITSIPPAQPTTPITPPPTTVPPAQPTTPTTTPVPTTTGVAVAKYGQCGGETYSGSTTCATGSTCTYSNPYYSQCL